MALGYVISNVSRKEQIKYKGKRYNREVHFIPKKNGMVEIRYRLADKDGNTVEDLELTNKIFRRTMILNGLNYDFEALDGIEVGASYAISTVLALAYNKDIKSEYRLKHFKDEG